MLELEPSYTDGGNVNWCSCYGASLFLIAPKQKHLKMFINRWVDKLWYIDIGFPASSVSEESTHNEGDLGSIPELGRSPGGGHGNHSSILAWRILMDRGTWWATVHGVAESQTWLSTHNTCGILVPGITPLSPALQVRFLTVGLPGMSPFD